MSADFENLKCESDFERQLIECLASMRSSTTNISDVHRGSYLNKAMSWQYLPKVKTTEQLWANFKAILEQHNQNTLDQPLSKAEFKQVKNAINALQTPYEAGQFLYGLNGVSQIEIDLDDGRHVFLTVFDQKQIGAGDTIYQVVNQIERQPVIAGKPKRVFDTTLLINGLPTIQIEEKFGAHDIDEALNQMRQYADEHQYHDIFSTLQILVAITPHNVKYMANTTTDQFNTDFAFNWQREHDHKPVHDWREFADSMLSIPMAHQMATNYMILDGTQNKQTLKVMRPYQVYATRRVIDKLKHVDYEFGQNKVGYIWHTTGSGKTITSFKTAWLASRLPNVDKVVFVVDRIALTKQTMQNYKAYDPDSSEESLGSVLDASNTSDLSRKLKTKDNSIIITSVQKLDTLVKRKSFKAPDKNIVFIVDEAHRSTGGDSFKNIQSVFKHSAWVGYTGTPMFEDSTNGTLTEQVFGKLLHSYTIREAIADHNVLGFKVDFETTIDDKEMREHYLRDFFRSKFPSWSDEDIQAKINNLTQDDMDDTVESSFYDENEDHVRLVVEDIFAKWQNRSNEGKYNALLTTHVGGNGASTPMAMMYFNEFQRVNAEHAKNGSLTLKVAVTFSSNTSNNGTMLETNRGLFTAMQAYNQEFGTSFDMSDVGGYTQDVISRLDRTANDGQFLDIVIVVDQLLTGFDAPELNTLYVDRTLKNANLIQAYSRTNRIADMQDKPFGRIINYRWPAQNEKLMNKALAIYANNDSANISDEKLKELNEETGVIAKSFDKELRNVQGKVEKLRSLTSDFSVLPPSEKQQEFMAQLLREYNAGVAKLKQYTPEQRAADSDGADGSDDANSTDDTNESEVKGFDYSNPDKLVRALGMTSDEEALLTTVFANQLRENLAQKKHVPYTQIQLRMTHVKDVKVNYDCLTELVQNLLNQVHEGKHEDAQETHEKIRQFAHGLDNRSHAKEIMNAAEAISSGLFPPDSIGFEYPAQLKDSDDIIRQANELSLDRMLLDFRVKWGITDIITSAQMQELFAHHHYGKQDLDDAGQITDILTKACDRNQYTALAHDESIQALSKIKYRNQLRAAINALADTQVVG
ncbi:DEAD/DEAH box helicase [Bifidobacterium aquikefiri]|mgnify:CR=1 FL=1|uniref:Type I restriction enzyme endonuclease subunit n=2 Tax=Bifidobacterium aquikefiri TaxID=1653207 RepID=A0A261G926_9BIFI|nr:DEAD/DEAH box helicase [Bifidobacterium aquikefiri]